jgi:predicted  nucleic acid-binding Zn-ribbon protein
MIPFLKDTIRFSNDHRTSKWALETLAETQQYLEERDRVEAENRKQREAYEKMRADYDKKYGKTKKKSGG